jgi:murein DD-endopeptidase MepM/ murein hydrolase activator NlpD
VGSEEHSSDTDAAAAKDAGTSPETGHDADRATRAERATLNRLAREAAKEVKRRNREATTARRRGGGSTGSTTEIRPGGRTTRSRLTIRIRRVSIITIGSVLLLCVLFPPFLIPVHGTTTSRFFLRNAPDSNRLFDFETHHGIDIAAPIGTPVIASRSGRVINVGTSGDYGTYIDIRHPLGVVTRYAHLSRTNVSEGQWVWRRKTIGAVGMTGRTTGPHLHFEVRLGNRPLPPGVFLFFHGIRRLITG